MPHIYRHLCACVLAVRPHPSLPYLHSAQSQDTCAAPNRTLMVLSAAPDSSRPRWMARALTLLWCRLSVCSGCSVSSDHIYHSRYKSPHNAHARTMMVVSYEALNSRVLPADTMVVSA